ncbi:Virulence-regulating protein VirS [Phaeobacter sp. CECT 5382]|uniref:AraC family transcriptional regulator n=1 Tax=Rhodobacterales TaxID=204455 RepID=UPI0006DAAC95|nr:AraC family transcriptional regulator [Phaeobacter sp. CECT 5382]CUH87088.1 Virulence-regulating protein VirS [Phaeobacter sp. CECT 5382]
MTTVSAIYARKQIEHAVQIPDKDRLFDIIGLTPETVRDPSVMVSVADYYDLLEAIAESEFPDLQFHMKTCRSMCCDEFGVFGLAFKSAPTLRHGFQRIWRYIRLHNRVASFSADQDGDRFCWSMQAPYVDRLGSFLSNEAAMATTLTLCRETTSNDLQPRHVQFVHEREGSIDALVAHFGCVPEFGAQSDALHFDIEQVDQPCTIGDAGIWSFLIEHLDQALAKEEVCEQPFETQVIEEIAKLLSGGVPQLSEVSKTMGLGGRTFQRRLNERGKSFQALVDEARQKLAQQLISASTYSFSEIAFLTGFSEQSAFSRAFKRWSGQTPKAYRLELQAGTSAGLTPD